MSNIVAEFTRFNPLIGNNLFSNRYMKVEYDRQTVVLDLTKIPEEIWEKQYSSSNRNMIRKGENSLDIKIETNEQNVMDFGRLYYKTMRRLNAKRYYFFNDNYFKDFYRLLKDNIFIISAVDKVTGVKLCSLMLLVKNKYAHYHLSGREIMIQNNAANNFTLHHAIQYAKEIGCARFHFGGGNSSFEDDSLLKYKKNFSKEYLNFFVGRFINNNNVYEDIITQWEKMCEIKIVKNTNLLRYREIRKACDATQ